ncbi:hypothetical protein PIB30_029731 [Stylosanthes scabra]|uniref:Aldose 1-epimerase n=1 Tax=Stylosanthes scabra TaxID=79078 RepID=A0ABU6YBI9_9FABA|nr:hypothetical protein [Stylosanthes scabra]
MFNLQNDTQYFGATVGRVANRIGGAQFTLNGIHYKLIANEGNNALHGNHNSGNILNQVVQIFASEFTPFDDQLIPTGNFSSVKGTLNDFLKPQVVGSRINQLSKTNGYNVNYVLDKNHVRDITVHMPNHDHNEITVADIVMDKRSGRVMKIATNQPGLQFYTANYVKNDKGKDGFVYQPRSALCLETQAFPDSVNHPNFPSTIVTTEKPYKHIVFFKFSTDPPRGFS